jgi:hypothetical protein
MPETKTVLLNFKGTRNRFQGIDSVSLCSLSPYLPRSPGINSETSILRNRFLGCLKGLHIRSLVGRYDSPIPTRFLAPADCSKIPTLSTKIKFRYPHLTKVFVEQFSFRLRVEQEIKYFKYEIHGLQYPSVVYNVHLCIMYKVH